MAAAAWSCAQECGDHSLNYNMPNDLRSEDRKKVLRRQRNKEAAARCRKRRLDQTVTLEDQVLDQECKSAEIRREIEALSAQESSLLAILESHKSKCKMGGSTTGGSGKLKTKLNNNDESRMGKPDGGT